MPADRDDRLPPLGPGHNHANPGYHADCGWCVRGFTDREVPLSDDKLPEKIEEAIKADLPPAFWKRISLLRAAIREALDKADERGFDRGLEQGKRDGREAARYGAKR